MGTIKQIEGERDQLKSELESEIQYLLDDKDRAQSRHMVSEEKVLIYFLFIR